MNARRLSHFASKSVRGSDLQRWAGKKSQKVTRGSHRNDVSPLTQGLRYRAACDVPAQYGKVLYCHHSSHSCSTTLPDAVMNKKVSSAIRPHFSHSYHGQHQSRTYQKIPCFTRVKMVIHTRTISSGVEKWHTSWVETTIYAAVLVHFGSTISQHTDLHTLCELCRQLNNYQMLLVSLTRTRSFLPATGSVSSATSL